MQKNPYFALLLGLFLMLLAHQILPNLLNGYHQNSRSLEDFIIEEMGYRHHDPVFSRRLLTTFLIDRLHFGLGISYYISYLSVGFGFFALFGGLHTQISRNFGLNNRQILLSILVFFTSFSVLFAYCSPIYTHDEPLQYCFVALSILFIQKKQDFLLFLSLIVAVFARETTFLLFPSLFFIKIFENQPEKSDFSIKKLLNIKYTVLFALIVVIYLVFYYNFYGAMAQDKGRWLAWQTNFQNPTYFIETIVSAFVVLVLPLCVVRQRFMSILPTESEPKNTKEVWIKAFFIALVINTIVVLATTTAREARLFALPLLLIFGFLGEYYEAFFIYFYKNVTGYFNQNKIFFYIKTFSTLLLCAIFSFVVYHSTDSAGSQIYYQIYLFIVSSIVSLYFLYNIK
jgi:hypothetical protein